MRRFSIFLMVALGVGLLGWRWGSAAKSPGQPPLQDRLPTTVEHSRQMPAVPGENQVLDINVHTEPELTLILRRVEAVAQQRQSQAGAGEIALVLHGPEVAFFARHNYERYRDLVDLAAKLSAFELIDIKMCQSMMNALEIEEQDVPAFIEQVPYGPGEVERLEQEGFVRM